MKECGKCRALSEDSDLQCWKCGGSLQKNFEERFSAPPPDKTESTVNAFMVFVVLTLTVFSFFVYRSVMGPSTPAKGDPEIGITTEITACGGKSDMAAAINAAHSKDRDGMLGLVERGKLKPIAAGVKVEVGIRNSPLAFVRIASGQSLNEHCWMPENAFR